MSRNLLIITQRVDADDDLLGFFVDWIREFSKYFDQVFVITLARGRYDLPGNVQVHSLGKELGTSKVSRFFKFYSLLFKYTPQSQSIFAHMSPVFAIAAWPVARLLRKRIVLWYLHRSVTLRLKIAEKVSHKIVTAAQESLQLRSDKIIEVGHGINAEKFATVRNWEKEEPCTILSVGRISPIKNYETLIEAVRILKGRGISCTVTIVGRPIMPADAQYLESLRAKVKNCELESFVHFAGYVPYVQVADYYRKADIVVNLTPTGGIDKMVLEGMASGALILGSNLALRHLVLPYDNDSLFVYGNAEDLAGHLQRLIALPSEKKNEMSRVFVEKIKSESDVTHVVERIQELL